MTTTTNVQQVKVNKVTQAQYDSMTKNDNEFYVIVDKEYLDGITSADVTTALGYTPISAVTSSMVTNALGYTPYNSTNPAGYISGITSADVTTALGYTPISAVTSADVTTALGYTPYNSTNPAGYISGITSADVTTALGYTPISAVTSSMVTNALGFTPANASGVQTVQDMTTLSSGTITLTDANSLYVRQPSAATTFTFSNSTSASSTKAYTFELCIKMTTVYAISWPSSVTWQDGEIPDLSSTGTYFLAFRTIDGGSTWLGNLQGKW